MNIKQNVKFLIDDLKGKNGFVSFMNSALHSVFILGILITIVWAICVGIADFVSCCAGVVLAIFMLNNFARDKEIEELKDKISKDKSSKGISINLDKINQQMQDMQDED